MRVAQGMRGIRSGKKCIIDFSIRIVQQYSPWHNPLGITPTATLSGRSDMTMLDVKFRPTNAVDLLVGLIVLAAGYLGILVIVGWLTL
jgi:hypothetical protein